MTRYDTAFYEEIQGGSHRSAAVIVPIVTDLLRPSSVVDVGCGTGTWLRAFSEAGASEVLGVDGDYVDRNALEIPVDRFLPADLSAGTVEVGDRMFDLAVSLEVAEHLPPDAADRFVTSLCKLAPIVLFSAAVPVQGGHGHVNEQWPDWWAEKFDRLGFRVVDYVRPRVWGDPAVETSYAQNTFLYASEQALVARPELADVARLGGRMPLRVVHPRLFLLRTTPGAQPIPPLRHALGTVVDSARAAVSRRLGKSGGGRRHNG